MLDGEVLVADCVKTLLPCRSHIFYLILDAFNTQFRVFWCAEHVKLSPWPQRTTGEQAGADVPTDAGAGTESAPEAEYAAASFDELTPESNATVGGGSNMAVILDVPVTLSWK